MGQKKLHFPFYKCIRDVLVKEPKTSLMKRSPYSSHSFALQIIRLDYLFCHSFCLSSLEKEIKHICVLRVGQCTCFL